MKGCLRKCASLSLLVMATAAAGPVFAGSVTGVAVDSSGNPVASVTDSNGRITYFIPLNGDNAGVFGEALSGGPNAGKLAGTFSDYGDGFGYNDPNSDALKMYLRYDLSSLDANAASATLSFRFDDLDLIPNNDPYKFFEDVQFHYDDGTALNPLTDTLLRDDDNGPVRLVDLGATVMADASDNNRIHVVFPGLAPILNGLPDNADALYLRLDFSSQYKTEAYNTAEHLLSSVLTTTTVVPVPAAAWLGLATMGGLGILGKIRKKRSLV